MVVAVGRVVDARVVVGEIPAVHIIHIAVAVVVYAVARYLVDIDPDVAPEVRVVYVNPLVYDRDDGGRAPGGGAPGFLRIHVGVGRTTGLPGVVQAVEFGVVRIVRRNGHRELLKFVGRNSLRGLQQEVRLGVLHVRRRFVSLYGLAHREVARQIHHVNVALGQILFGAGVVALVEGGKVRLGRLVFEHDDDLVFGKLAAIRRGVGRLLPHIGLLLRLGLDLLRSTLQNYEEKQSRRQSTSHQAYPLRT